MFNTFELYDICLCTAILTLFFLLRYHSPFSLERAIVHRTRAGIRRLLAPPTTSKDNLLHSRAAANARLIRAFDLTNTFVSADPIVHSRFRSASSALLHVTQRDWNQFTCVAVQAVELALPAQSTPFHTYVRSVVLSTVIVGVLDPTADITALDSHDLEVVANLITELWILSKSPAPIPTDLLWRLNDHLRRLIPDEDDYPNPLDFIIPAWETMWRVVAVTLAHVHADAAACGAFLDLNANPSSSQFRLRGLSGTSPSVEDYINESLRLHPPVRHITRQEVRKSGLTHFLPRFLAACIPPSVYTAIADIESAQRSACWGTGADPEAYNAARFLREPGHADDLLAFGFGPLKCVASQWAPMAAAVIVGAILNRVDGVGHEIVRGECIGGREGWEGWMVRNVHSDT